MKAKALRLYGKEDLRLDEYELPEIKDDEILARVVSDSICMSSYKAAWQLRDTPMSTSAATLPILLFRMKLWKWAVCFILTATISSAAP